VSLLALPAVIALVVAGGLVLLSSPQPTAAATPGSSTGTAKALVARPAPVAVAGVMVLGLLLVVAPAVVAVAAAVTAVVLAERRRGAARSQRARRAESLDEAVAAMAVDLRSGGTPAAALASAARTSPELFADAARAAEWGADPTPALRRSADLAGAGPLLGVASAWEVAARTGCSLADVLDRLRHSVHASQATGREVAETLAPARATARVLAVLPVAGVGVGAAIGVDVPALLLGTTWGQACLAAAVGLVALGLWAVEVIARWAGGWT
jgi:tight adherence protein B